MNLIKMQCEKCGATLEVDTDLEKNYCQYCGSELLIDDEATKLKRIEDVKLKARKNNHEQSLKERDDLLQQEVKEQEIKADLNATEKFKKGKFSKVLLVFFALSVLMFFVGEGICVKGLILIQAVCFLVSWLMGMRIIKEPFKGIRIGLAIIAFILIVPIVKIGPNSEGKESEKIDWDEIVLHEILPEPAGDYGLIIADSKEDLSLYIHDQSKEDYQQYVNACKKKGFKIDAIDETNSYDAYNKKGYKLEINFDEYSEEYSIDLSVPIKMQENVWPDSALANMLPKPKSLKGNVESDSSSYFCYYAANTSKDEYLDYISQLKTLGFVVDYYNNDNSYSASNNANYDVDVYYEGFDIMKITISAPDEDKTDTTDENKDVSKDGTTTDTSTTGLRADFKATMDSYEKFMDEYAAFMKKYTESDGTDLTLINDYSTMMGKYNTFVKDFEKWESEDLNSEETKYYLEVQARVAKKLATVQE